jgi:two-component system response regulator RegA
VRDLHALDASTRIIVLTGYGSIATAVEAVRLGAFNYLPKPADVDDLLLAFSRGPGEVAEVSEDFQPPTLARAEWEHIQRVLADCGGNISEAARRLGLHRRSLQRKLQKYPPAQ